jgi:hypothetical protein
MDIENKTTVVCLFIFAIALLITSFINSNGEKAVSRIPAEEVSFVPDPDFQGWMPILCFYDRHCFGMNQDQVNLFLDHIHETRCLSEAF